jgi:tRNA (guanine-N(7)-)-methyltransferase subunit TRM82
MADMNHPFQCIEAVEKLPSEGSEGCAFILAACGPKLVVLSINRGEIVSQWSASVHSNTIQEDSHERPTKKQKISSNPASLPNIIKLTVTPSNQHAVVVTDDKCLRVFDISHEGEITELSQRFVPKRPCAVHVLPDNATILCGDKFGDVYALPLLPQETEPGQHTAAESEELEHPKEPTSTFKPSASNLTVHTKRNLKSLEAQLKQKNLTPKTKEPLKFEHKLLLGHVSMLTDLCYATQEVDGKQRAYIITADRDEHIRVSRGPPQSHIIEGYCLGHTEFVSKILAIPETDLLISGGGDDWLGVWEWPSFKLRGKIHDFKTRVHEAEPYPPDREPNPNPVPVSGMWIVRGTIDEKPQDVVIVTCEKSSILSWFPVSELLKPADEEEIFWSTEHLGAPVLAITQIGDKILVSRREPDPKLERIVTVRLEASNGAFTHLQKDSDKDWEKSIRPLEQVTSTVASEESLNEFLYTVEGLRKRTYKERENEEEE